MRADSTTLRERSSVRYRPVMLAGRMGGTAAGVPLADVSRQLRHADVAITAAVDGHLLGEDRRHAAVATFDALEDADTLRGDLAGVEPIGRNERLAGDPRPASADF
jgi:alpha-D-ribose 1-methylphosphonate 5-triphosphate synthase subunit PhnG